MSPARPLLLMSALLFVCAACGQDKSQEGAPKRAAARLGAVQWRVLGGDYAAPSRKEFEEAAVRALSDLPPLPGAVKGSRIGVEGALDIKDGQGMLILECRARIAGLRQPLQAGVAATGQAASAASASVLIDNGLADLKKALLDMIALLKAGPKRWVSALDSVEPDEQILAARLLGRDKVKQAIPSLGRLLSDPREQVQEAASEALAEIGDESAVPLLIGSIRRGDLRSEVRAIEVMGRIGGPEARAYLEMTAVGHQVDEVRRLSSSLLKRMK